MTSNKKLRGRARKAKAKSVGKTETNSDGIADKLIKDDAKENTQIISPSHLQLFTLDGGGCMHGYDASETPETLEHPIDALLVPALEAIRDCEMKNEDTVDAFRAAHNALFANQNRLSIDYGSPVIELMSRRLLCIGTNLLFDRPSEFDGRAVNYLYQMNIILTMCENLSQSREVQILGSKPCFYRNKLLDLLNSDERRMVSYVRKRIPCACLDARFSMLKHLPKMGMCNNVLCNRGRIELNKLLSCERCRKSHYCSQACQQEDFDIHKQECIKFKKWMKDKPSAD